MQARMIARITGRSAADQTSGRTREIAGRMRVLLVMTSASANRKKSAMASGGIRASVWAITTTIDSPRVGIGEQAA